MYLSCLICNSQRLTVGKIYEECNEYTKYILNPGTHYKTFLAYIWTLCSQQNVTTTVRRQKTYTIAH